MRKNLKSLYVLAALSMGIAMRSQGQNNNNPVQESAWKNSQNLPGSYEWQRNADNKGYHFATTYITDNGKKVQPIHVDVDNNGKLQSATSFDPKGNLTAILDKFGIVGYRLDFDAPEVSKTVQKALDSDYTATTTLFLNPDGTQLKNDIGDNDGAQISIINTKDNTKTNLDPTRSAAHSDLGEINSHIPNLSSKNQTRLADMLKNVRTYGFSEATLKDIESRIADVKAFISMVAQKITPPTNKQQTTQANNPTLDALKNNTTTVTAPPSTTTTNVGDYELSNDNLILDTQVPQGEKPIVMGEVLKSANGQVLGINIQDPQTGVWLAQQIKQGKVVNTRLLMSWADLATAMGQAPNIIKQAAMADNIINKYTPYGLNGIELTKQKDGKYLATDHVIAGQHINIATGINAIELAYPGINPINLFLWGMRDKQPANSLVKKVSTALELSMGTIGDGVIAVASSTQTPTNLDYDTKPLEEIAQIVLKQLIPAQKPATAPSLK